MTSITRSLASLPFRKWLNSPTVKAVGWSLHVAAFIGLAYLLFRDRRPQTPRPIIDITVSAWTAAFVREGRAFVPLKTLDGHPLKGGQGDFICTFFCAEKNRTLELPSSLVEKAMDSNSGQLELLDGDLPVILNIVEPKMLSTKVWLEQWRLSALHTGRPDCLPWLDGKELTFFKLTAEDNASDSDAEEEGPVEARAEQGSREEFVGPTKRYYSRARCNPYFCKDTRKLFYYISAPGLTDPENVHIAMNEASFWIFFKPAFPFRSNVPICGPEIPGTITGYEEQWTRLASRLRHLTPEAFREVLHRASYTICGGILTMTLDTH